VIVLLVDFPDNRGTDSTAHFDELLFGGGSSARPTLTSYYRDASSKRLSVDGEVLGWYTLPQPLNFYVDNNNAMGNYPHNGQKLVEDALDAAVKAGVDFSRFDLDNDGHVDGLVVVHAGGGAEEETDDAKRRKMIWSHKWTIPNARTLNGVSVWAYTLQPENGRVGVFCHEFGHFLGLPDLYDTTNRSEGVGMWCVMGAGSWGGLGHTPTDFCAWSRWQLGWVKQTDVTNVQRQQIKPAYLDGPALRVASSACGPMEYFILESRQRDGIDTGLPGEGLLVWHIDDSQQGNDDPRHYQVGVVQADGNQDLEFAQNRGDEGDPFPGSTQKFSFDDTTNPSSRTYGGKQSSISLANISYDPHNGMVTLDVKVNTRRVAKAPAPPRRIGSTAPSPTRGMGRQGVASAASGRLTRAGTRGSRKG
jgi:immune inhibitor A